jgi:hypothetical protein
MVRICQSSTENLGFGGMTLRNPRGINLWMQNLGH